MIRFGQLIYKAVPVFMTSSTSELTGFKMSKQVDFLQDGKFLFMDKPELIGLGGGIALCLALLISTGMVKDQLLPSEPPKKLSQMKSPAKATPPVSASNKQKPVANPSSSAPTAKNSASAQQPAVATVAAIPADDLKLSAEETVNTIKKLQNCTYKPQDPACGLSSTIPSEVARQLNARVERHVHHLLWQIENGQAKGINLAEVSRSLIKMSDQEIQRKALELMSLSSPDPKNVDAIIGNLSKSRDPDAIYQALIELQRYPAPYLKDKIDNFLLNTIESGYPATAQEIARNVIPFFNKRNIEKFRSLAKRLPPMSPRSKYLKIKLDNYYIVEDEGTFGR
jgi:hypothetical protein